MKRTGRGTSADFFNYNLNLIDKTAKIEAIKNVRVRPLEKDDDDASDGDNEDDVAFFHNLFILMPMNKKTIDLFGNYLQS